MPDSVSHSTEKTHGYNRPTLTGNSPSSRQDLRIITEEATQEDYAYLG